MAQIRFQALLVLFTGTTAMVFAGQTDKPPSTITRTELKVSRSLNPENTQTLNVMTKDGSVAQLIVKRREPKTKPASLQSLQDANVDWKPQNSQYSRSIYTNWIPVSSAYLKPNLIRLDAIAVVRNATDTKPKTTFKINNNLGNVIDSDRIPHVPKPVTIRSDDIYVKPNDYNKRGRSFVQIDNDGIPVVHGVRVPDDDSDKQTWRNARVINGELVPYEDGYKPPAAVPLGQLVYASHINNNNNNNNNNNKKDDSDESGSIGPFSKADNFKNDYNDKRTSIGPFTIKDNLNPLTPSQYAEIRGNGGFVPYNIHPKEKGIGPFSKADIKQSKSKLIDYIKEINTQEAKKDYFSPRQYRSYDIQSSSAQIQRRMLQYPGNPTYTNSLLYTPTSTKLSPVNFNEGVRTPVVQYAHPELGVQPARVTPEDDNKSYKDNDANYSPYDLRPDANSDLEGGRKSQYPDTNTNRVAHYKKDIINYPYNTYYLKPKQDQPFWAKITESIKDNVQSGFQRMQQLTRPVFEPLFEATQKISHNLGFGGGSSSRQKAQDKVGFVTPMGGSVILPALGLVAGGAALGLGAAAFGRFINPAEMRGFHHGMRPNDIFVIMEEKERAKHRRYRRSLNHDHHHDDDDYYYMQQLALSVEKENKWKHLAAPHLWTDTPCAKKLFCDVMMHQNTDEIILMEKKMHSLLSTIEANVANSVARHLHDVMDAVKLGDCSKFYCAKKTSAPAA